MLYAVILQKYLVNLLSYSEHFEFDFFLGLYKCLNKNLIFSKITICLNVLKFENLKSLRTHSKSIL